MPLLSNDKTGVEHIPCWGEIRTFRAGCIFRSSTLSAVRSGRALTRVIDQCDGDYRRRRIVRAYGPAKERARCRWGLIKRWAPRPFRSARVVADRPRGQHYCICRILREIHPQSDDQHGEQHRGPEMNPEQKLRSRRRRNIRRLERAEGQPAETRQRRRLTRKRHDDEEH
jgi:hypothetical protein